MNRRDSNIKGNPMELFYRVLIWLMRFELAIAESCGGRATWRSRLSEDITTLEGDYLRWRMNHA